MRPKVFRGKNVPDNLCFCSQGPCAWECEECLRCEQHYNDLIDFIKYGDLTKIEKPFGLLPEDIQKALKEAWDGKTYESGNIQIFECSLWGNCKPTWERSSVYRLDPLYKPEETVKMTVLEVSKLVGKKVEIVEERT